MHLIEGHTLDKLVGIGNAMAQSSKGSDWRFHTSCRSEMVFDLHKISRGRVKAISQLCSIQRSRQSALWALENG